MEQKTEERSDRNVWKVTVKDLSGMVIFERVTADQLEITECGAVVFENIVYHIESDGVSEPGELMSRAEVQTICQAVRVFAPGVWLHIENMGA